MVLTGIAVWMEKRGSRKDVREAKAKAKAKLASKCYREEGIRGLSGLQNENVR
jgi:hypothetical protein